MPRYGNAENPAKTSIAIEDSDEVKRVTTYTTTPVLSSGRPVQCEVRVVRCGGV